MCLCVYAIGHAVEYVCARLDKPSTKMASEDYTDWDGINSAVCVGGGLINYLHH